MRTIVTKGMSDATKYRKIFSITATANTQSFFFGNEGRGYAKFNIVSMHTGQGSFSIADFILYNYNGTYKILCTKSNNNINIFGAVVNDVFTVYAKANANYDFIVQFESLYEDLYTFYDYDTVLYNKADFVTPIGISALVNQPIQLSVTIQSGLTADPLSYTNNMVELCENGRYLRGQIVLTTSQTVIQNILTLPLPIQKSRLIGYITDTNNKVYPYVLLQNQGTGLIYSYIDTTGISVSKIIIDIDSPIFVPSYPKGISIPGV